MNNGHIYEQWMNYDGIGIKCKLLNTGAWDHNYHFFLGSILF